MKFNKLNDDQIDYIKKNYNYLRTSTIAKNLGVSGRYLQWVADSLGLVDLRNKYIIEGNIAKVLCVTMKNEHVYFEVDLDDLERVLNYGKWFLKRNKNKLYVVTNKEIDGKRNIVRLHRFILNFPEKNIDHIDGNALNNTKSNLRLCEHHENMSNLQKCRSDNKTTGVLNVHLCPDGYRPEIQINKKRVYFKSYKNLEDATYLVKYVRANYLPYSQEAFNKESINTNTPEAIKVYADKKVKEKINVK